MTDLEYAKQKKRVGKYLTKWQDCMGLKWWNIQIVWDRSYSSSENPGAAAETNMNGWKYRQAGITFYLPKIAEEPDADEIEKLVVHELCHVLLGPISTNMEDLNGSYQRQLMEFNTDLVADALLWTRRAARDAKV